MVFGHWTDVEKTSMFMKVQGIRRARGQGGLERGRGAHKVAQQSPA